MTDKYQNIYLIGPMGAGKTTIGRAIAQQSPLTFFDCDQEIVQRSGVEISWIFAEEGEAGFRRREHDMLKQLTQKTDIVLATGGGCVTVTDNLPLLTESGIVVYLTVSLTKQLQRLKSGKSKRPLFQANDNLERLEKLNAEREPLYRRIADFIYNTDENTPQAIATEILAEWHKHQKSTG